jgi:hypothetical protein
MDRQPSNEASNRQAHTLHEEHEPTSGSAEQQSQSSTNSSSDEVKLLLHGTPLAALPKDAEGVERGSLRLRLRRRRGHVGDAVEWLWSIGIEYL